MERIRFLTDEHVPKAVAKGLRERGIDAVTAAEAKTLGAEDSGLHAAGVPHAGIVYAPPDTSIGAMIRGALLIADVLDSDAMMNHVEFL